MGIARARTGKEWLQRFSRRFGLLNVEVDLGSLDAVEVLRRQDAEGVTIQDETGATILFRDAEPTLSVVLEEVTHVLQETEHRFVHQGVAVRAFTARLRVPSAPYHAPARFDLGRDRAWGLISVRRHLLNIVVVGGGLAAAADFWPRLQRIEPQGFPALDAAALERVSVPFELDGGAWELPTLRTYAQGDEKSQQSINGALRPSRLTEETEVAAPFQGVEVGDLVRVL